MAEKDPLRELQQEELELERLRQMVSPEHWPRIYSMLKRVREEIRRQESKEAKGGRAA